MEIFLRLLACDPDFALLASCAEAWLAETDFRFLLRFVPAPNSGCFEVPLIFGIEEMCCLVAPSGSRIVVGKIQQSEAVCRGQ